MPPKSRTPPIIKAALRHTVAVLISAAITLRIIAPPVFSLLLVQSFADKFVRKRAENFGQKQAAVVAVKAEPVNGIKIITVH